MKTNVAQNELHRLEDETLVQLFVDDAARYGQAFDILVTRYQSKVYGLCLRMMGNAEEAEDQAQEVFIKIYRSLGRFEGRARFSTWMYRIAVNACLDALEKRRRRPQAADAEWSDLGETLTLDLDPFSWQSKTPEQYVLQAEQVSLVHNALASLDEPYRQALVQRELEGLSYQEMASLAQAGLSAMKMRVHRGRKALTNVLQGQLAPAAV
jgi:RNA polymerase sigma-70 factor (ECF subfamily)